MKKYVKKIDNLFVIHCKLQAILYIFVHSIPSHSAPHRLASENFFGEEGLEILQLGVGGTQIFVPDVLLNRIDQAAKVALHQVSQSYIFFPLLRNSIAFLHPFVL